MFTHPSWAAARGESYERLEFLGDSVLELAIARTLYDRFPDFDEGQLAKLRSQVVSRASCAVIAAELGLGERLAANHPTPRLRRGSDGSPTTATSSRRCSRPRSPPSTSSTGSSRGRAGDRRCVREPDRLRAHPPGRPQDRAAGGARPPRAHRQLRARSTAEGPPHERDVHRGGADRRRRGRASGAGDRRRAPSRRPRARRWPSSTARRPPRPAGRDRLRASAARRGRSPGPGRRATIRRHRQTLRSRVPEDGQASRLQVVRRSGRGAPRAGGGGRRRAQRLGEVQHLRCDPLGDRVAQPARAPRREARRRAVRRLLRRGPRSTSARSSSCSTTTPAPGPTCPTRRSRSAAGSTAAARASTSSTARRCAGSTSSSCSPTSGSAAACAR